MIKNKTLNIKIIFKNLKQTYNYFIEHQISVFKNNFQKHFSNTPLNFYF